MQPFCANCYKRNAEKHCGKCGCRYCSRECQVNHWTAFHKKWCGKSGQWGRDFEIKDSPDKQGVGIFALRDIKKYEVILAERVATIGPGRDFETVNDDRLPPMSKAELDIRIEGGINPEKMITYPVCSRMNHDCIGNARSTKNDTFVLAKAARDIAAGEEICHPYFDQFWAWDRYIDYKLPFEDRSQRRSSFTLFECNCGACTNPAIDGKMRKLYTMLSNELDTPLAKMDVAKINEDVKQMVALADELGCAPTVYFNIYNILYATMLLSGQFHPQQDEVKEVAAKLNEIGEKWYGPDSEEAKFAEKFVQNGGNINN